MVRMGKAINQVNGEFFKASSSAQQNRLFGLRGIMGSVVLLQNLVLKALDT